jgi:F0F1-type ATP synthase beta subunit
MGKIGKVVQVIGPVVDVEFEREPPARDLQRGAHRRRGQETGIRWT